MLFVFVQVLNFSKALDEAFIGESVIDRWRSPARDSFLLAFG